MTGEKTGRVLVIVGWAFGLCFVAVIAAAIYLTSPGFLVKMLSSDDVRHRRWAADELVRQGEGAGKRSLALATDTRADAEARRLAVFVLGEIGYRESTPELLALFRGGDPVLREQSAYALGRMGDAAVAPELIGAYEGAPKGVKMKIIAALGELPTERGISLLKRESEAGTDDTLKDAAAYALKKIAEKEKEKGAGAR
ncbi:MAG: HEAT repeat domain-containing protein [Nitrospinae bacterium]|nr:HEAT repeat domain-containing protein [Nitrospinota bacterium]